MIGCSIEALSEADLKLLFDGESAHTNQHGNNQGVYLYAVVYLYAIV